MNREPNGADSAAPSRSSEFALLILDFLIVRINHVFLRASLAITALGATLRVAALSVTLRGPVLRTRALPSLAVHRLGEFVRRGRERLGGPIYLFWVL